MNSAYIAEVISTYGASEETMLKLRDIFLQGDCRYEDPEYEAIVAGFVDNGALSVSRTHIKPEKASLRGIPGPQKEMKAIAKLLLERSGYTVFSIERAFGGNIPDLLATGNDKLAVECGPCNLRKAIDYIEAAAVLWILKPTGLEYDLFEIRRAAGWDKMISIHSDRCRKATFSAVDAAFKPTRPIIP